MGLEQEDRVRARTVRGASQMPASSLMPPRHLEKMGQLNIWKLSSIIPHDPRDQFQVTFLSSQVLQKAETLGPEAPGISPCLSSLQTVTYCTGISMYQKHSSGKEINSIKQGFLKVTFRQASLLA